MLTRYFLSTLCSARFPALFSILLCSLVTQEARAGEPSDPKDLEEPAKKPDEGAKRTDDAPKQDASAPAKRADDGPKQEEVVTTRRTDELESQLVAKDVEVEALRREAEETKKKVPTVSAVAGKGITIQDEAGRSSLTLRPRVQIRETFTHNEISDANEVNVKTLRLVMHGHILGPKLRYFLQLAFGTGDYEKDNASPIFDAYVESAHERDINVRIGQFFVPFDRARTTREFGLQFVDRQQVVRELTLDRDVGIMASSSDLFGLKERLGYHLFIGGGEGRNQFGGKELGPLHGRAPRRASIRKLRR